MKAQRIIQPTIIGIIGYCLIGGLYALVGRPWPDVLNFFACMLGSALADNREYERDA